MESTDLQENFEADEYMEGDDEHQSEKSDLSEPSSDTSSEDLGRVALAFDPSQLSGCDSIPQNGHDYLRLVQLQRNRLPVVSSALSKPQHHQVVQETNKTKINSSIEVADDLQYRNEILENFKNLRCQIESARESIPARRSIDDETMSEKQIKEYRERSERKAKSLFNSMNAGFSPLTGDLVKRNQLEIHKTMEKLAEQCELNPNYSTLHTDWIYSLLAMLQEPIESDICSTIRRLAKLCINRRNMYEKRLMISNNKPASGETHEYKAASSSTVAANDVSSVRPISKQDNEELIKAIEEEEYTSSLLIICIVRHYFGQTDLR